MAKKALIRKILVAVDGSENSLRALKMAIYLAKELDGEVTALSIVDDSSLSAISEDVSTYQIYETLQNSAKRILEDSVKIGEEMGLKIKSEIGTGSPANEILKRSVGFDLIVVGTMGRTRLSYFLMGSVADRVVKRSKVPVLIVPLEEE
jgi:nucleotide-binding universal stress UspA family protein